jgi:hypothetical protein
LAARREIRIVQHFHLSPCAATRGGIRGILFVDKGDSRAEEVMPGRADKFVHVAESFRRLPDTTRQTPSGPLSQSS